MRIRTWVLGLCLLPVTAMAQAVDGAAIRTAVVAKYHMTQATADHSDIVTAGDVITLQKSGLVMYGLQNSLSMTGTVSYHDGKLNAGGMTSLVKTWGKLGKFGGQADSDSTRNREFVTGEKCWLIEATMKDDGLYLRFLSDPVSDIRYMGQIKFPIDKKKPVTSDEMVKLVSEVITGAPLKDDGGGDSKGGGSAPAAAPAAPPPPAMAPIAPPPPPPDQPAAPTPTISLGQTKDQVVAILGQPTKVITLGSKEIDTFTDLKVTFVKGKVTDVQ